MGNSQDLENVPNEEEITIIGMDDLQAQRDSKPRVTVEFKEVSYSVKGAKSEEDAEDEKKLEELRIAKSLANVTDAEEKEGEVRYPCGLATIGMCLRAREERSYISLIDRISGRVEPGMMLALMGPSGAGKCEKCARFFDFKCGISLIFFSSYSHGCHRGKEDRRQDHWFDRS